MERPGNSERSACPEAGLLPRHPAPVTLRRPRT